MAAYQNFLSFSVKQVKKGWTADSWLHNVGFDSLRHLRSIDVREQETSNPCVFRFYSYFSQSRRSCVDGRLFSKEGTHSNRQSHQHSVHRTPHGMPSSRYSQAKAFRVGVEGAQQSAWAYSFHRKRCVPWPVHTEGWETRQQFSLTENRQQTPWLRFLGWRFLIIT